MKGLIAMLALVGALLSAPLVKAEYCWMVGCKDHEGFIFTHVLKEERKELVFRGGIFPPAGSEATLQHFVNMSNAPPSSAEEGPYKLGPGSVVRVLEYVGKKKHIARVRVIRDDLEK